MSEWVLRVALGLAWKATVLLVLVALVDRLVRRRGMLSAAGRHRLWVLAFGGVLVSLPLADGLPGMRWSVLPAPADGANAWLARQLGHGSVTLRAEPAPPSASPSRGRHDPAGASAAPRLRTLDRQASRAHPAAWLGPVWLLGVMLLSLRWIVEALRARRLRRSSRAVPWGGPLPLRESARVDGPLVTGLLRPVIVVPPGLWDWDRRRRGAVLAHEQAHVRRRDPLASAVVDLAWTLLWFHPLAWYGRRRSRLEREAACDDAVLLAGRRDVDYAADLLAVVRDLRRPTPAAALGMARIGELEQRVEAILDRTRNRSRRAGPGLTLAGGALIGLLCLGLGPLAPAQGEPATASLLTGLGHGDAAVRAGCLERLADQVTRAEFPDVVPLAADPSPAVRTRALGALRRIGCLPAMLTITAALDDPDPAVRVAAAAELAHFRERSWWHASERTLRREVHASTARLVGPALDARREGPARDALRAARDDPHPAVAATARASWRRLDLP